MTKEEFIVQMKRLSAAYRGRFVLDPSDNKEVRVEVISTWYEFLGEHEAEDFENAVNKWIREEDAPPTIKTLRIKTLKQKWHREGLDE